MWYNRFKNLGVGHGKKSKIQIAKEKLALVRVDGAKRSRRAQHGTGHSLFVYRRAALRATADPGGADGYRNVYADAASTHQRDRRARRAAANANPVSADLQRKDPKDLILRVSVFTCS